MSERARERKKLRFSYVRLFWGGGGVKVCVYIVTKERKTKRSCGVKKKKNWTERRKEIKERKERKEDRMIESMNWKKKVGV